MSGHIGDTSPTPRGRSGDAREADQPRARTPSPCPGPREWPVDDDRTVPALRHPSERRVQVARSVPARGAARAPGPNPGPPSIPHPTPPDVAALILEEHRRSGWGARKILKRLRTRDSTRAWPAGSTIFDILARQRQRRPLRLDRHPRPQPPQRLLAPARHQPPAHHPRQPAGERRARTAPQGPRGASRATARGEPQPPTARLQPVPEDLQRAAAPPQP